MKDIKVYNCVCGGDIKTRIDRNTRRRIGKCDCSGMNTICPKYADCDLTEEEHRWLDMEERIEHLESLEKYREEEIDMEVIHTKLLHLLKP